MLVLVAGVYGELYGQYLQPHSQSCVVTPALSHGCQQYTKRSNMFICIYYSMNTILFGWFIAMQTPIDERNTPGRRVRRAVEAR